MTVTFTVGQGLGVSFAAEYDSLEQIRTQDVAAFKELVITELGKAVRAGKLQINVSYDVVE